MGLEFEGRIQSLSGEIEVYRATLPFSLNDNREFSLAPLQDILSL